MKEIIKSIWIKQKKETGFFSTVLAAGVCGDVYFISLSDVGFRSAIEGQVRFLLVMVIGRLIINIISEVVKFAKERQRG